jgi:hypothetical protein
MVRDYSGGDVPMKAAPSIPSAGNIPPGKKLTGGYHRKNRKTRKARTRKSRKSRRNSV